MLAQLSAAFRGHEASLEGGAVKVGYLAGIRDFKFTAKARAGDGLHLEMRQQFAMEQVFLVEGSVHRDELCLARGTLKLWEEAKTPHPPGLAPSNDVPDGIRSESHPDSLPLAHGSPMQRAIRQSLERVEDLGEEEGRAGGFGWFMLGEDFPAFHGHFPAFPILPGVIMLGLAAALCEALMKQPVEVREIGQAKFAQPVFPGQRVRTEVWIEPTPASGKVKAALAGEQGRIANFSFTVGPMPG
jgi:3-hydroxymyristoyl/3-hydroxydecanoyl-(acyl carrier protein) dehydratase